MDVFISSTFFLWKTKTIDNAVVANAGRQTGDGVDLDVVAAPIYIYFFPHFPIPIIMQR